MSTRRTTVFSMVLIAVVSMAVGMVLTSRLDLSSSSEAQSFGVPPMNSDPLTGTIDAQTFRRIATAQTPMVVNIRTESRRRTQDLTEFFGGDDLLRRFFGEPQQEQPREEFTQGAGTGFVIDEDGFILTNNHVVEGATKIEVGFFGDDAGETYEARLVGRDPLTDSALIELVEQPDRLLPVATFGDSNQMQPGDWVMAIGNPFNMAHTVTVGVISAIGRPFPVATGRSQDVLQTDADIKPGNSGGPLLNIRGEVVGINTAIVSDRASNVGIGFAIPINTVREILSQLQSGKVTRGRIGVNITPVLREAVEAFGLSDTRGAVVASVVPDGPAARGGLEPGDVIVEYAGDPVEDMSDLQNKVTATTPGTEVPVTIMRDRERTTLDITIEELDLETESQPRVTQNEGESPGFGMTLADLDGEWARRLRTPSDVTGAVIVDLDARGAAARAGMQRGDVVVEVNRIPIRGATAAVQELRVIDSGDTAFFLVWRGGTEIFVQATKE